MMWRFPELNVVAHGYGDAYTDSAGPRQHHRDRRGRLGRPGPGHGSGVRRRGPNSPLGYALIHTEHWTVQQDDPDLVMLRAPAGWLDQ